MKNGLITVCVGLFLFGCGSNLQANPSFREKQDLPAADRKGAQISQDEKKKPGEQIFDEEINKNTSNEQIFIIRMPSGWTVEKNEIAKRNNKKIVRGVLMLCTWHKNSSDLRDNVSLKQSRFKHLIQFADINNLAVVTWPNFGGYKAQISSDEMVEKEAKKFDELFAKKLVEWERGMKRIIKRFNLPTDSYMGYGLSGGAQILHRMALRKPQYFAGIHVHVNSSYDIPTPEGKKPVWLVSTGELELGYAAGRRFYQKMIEMDYSVIFKAGENLGHDSSPEIEALSVQFFKYILSFIPDPNNPKWKAPAADQYYLIKNPPYIGDYFNQVSYPAKRARENIGSEKFAVPLPTRELAEAWGFILE